MIFFCLNARIMSFIFRNLNPTNHQHQNSILYLSKFHQLSMSSNFYNLLNFDILILLAHSLLSNIYQQLFIWFYLAIFVYELFILYHFLFNIYHRFINWKIPYLNLNLYPLPNYYVCLSFFVKKFIGCYWALWVDSHHS